MWRLNTPPPPAPAQFADGHAEAAGAVGGDAFLEGQLQPSQSGRFRVAPTAPGVLSLMRELKPEGQCHPAGKSRPPCPSILPSCRTVCPHRDPNLQPCVSSSVTGVAWISQPTFFPSFLPSFPVTVMRCLAMGVLSEKCILRRCCPHVDVITCTHTNLATQAARCGLSLPGHEPVRLVAVRNNVRFSQAQEKTMLSGHGASVTWPHAAAGVTPPTALQQTFLKIIA